MSIFSSTRERRLWTWTALAVLAIYTTLGVSRQLVGWIDDPVLISNGFWLGLWLIGLAITVLGLRMRPSLAEVGVAMGVAAVYLLLFLRMNLPEERSHIIEYTIVALLIYEALNERKSQGRPVRFPALYAILAAWCVGTVDECIQLFMATRVFDLVDILFNCLSAVVAVTASASLAWARRFATRRLGPSP